MCVFRVWILRLDFYISVGRRCRGCPEGWEVSILGGFQDQTLCNSTSKSNLLGPCSQPSGPNMNYFDLCGRCQAEALSWRVKGYNDIPMYHLGRPDIAMECFSPVLEIQHWLCNNSCLVCFFCCPGFLFVYVPTVPLVGVNHATFWLFLCSGSSSCDIRPFKLNIKIELQAPFLSFSCFFLSPSPYFVLGTT